MKLRFLIICSLTLMVFGFVQITPVNLKFPSTWPKPVYDFKSNPLSHAKIELGRALFYDPILSANNSISCASCHSPYNAFTHVDHSLSHGINDSIGTRNSPALMNLAWQKSFMWDGAIHHLDVQALAPISHPAEMGSSISDVVKNLKKSFLYREAFYTVYGDSMITGERTLKCISQFMLTMVSSNSHYDKVKNGEEIFTSQEKKGYELFKLHCSSCHKEPLFTNGEFENNGIGIDSKLNDFGRMKITGNSNDSLLFKVPTLRNMEFTYPYMHDGRFATITQVLNHYTSHFEKSRGKSNRVKNRIQLSANEKTDLVSFLLTLTDRSFLFNKDLTYPKDFFSVTPKEKK